MRNWAALLSMLLTFGLASCTRQDADSAERKAGKTAHKIATDTEKAAKKAGQELRQAAKQVREGWNEGARQDQPKENNR